MADPSDPLGPSRGCAYGLVLGVLAWAAILALAALIASWLNAGPFDLGGPLH